MIKLNQVNKTYEMGGETIHALDHVDLVINNGDFIAVVGPSGSGKSTLANIIGGLDRPTSGQIAVDQDLIANMNDKELSGYRNRVVGFVFQSFNLQASLTAWENVAVPLLFSKMPSAKRKERAMECLKMVGLSDRENHKPSQLSGGQRQRVAIARALANNPKFVIADEPTGNLDSQKGREIMDLLMDLNQKQGVTLLIITHDEHVASRAHRIITIQDGKVKE